MDHLELLVAVCALVVAVTSLVWTRQHDRRLLQPRVSIRRSEDGLFLKNVGLGPAQIESAYAKIGEVRFDLADPGDLNAFVDAVAERVETETVLSIKTRLTVAGDGTWIPAEKERPILELFGEESQRIAFCTQLITSVDLVCEYTCIFGKWREARLRSRSGLTELT